LRSRTTYPEFARGPLVSSSSIRRDLAGNTIFFPPVDAVLLGTKSCPKRPYAAARGCAVTEVTGTCERFIPPCRQKQETRVGRSSGKAYPVSLRHPPPGFVSQVGHSHPAARSAVCHQIFTQHSPVLNAGAASGIVPFADIVFDFVPGRTGKIQQEQEKGKSMATAPAPLESAVSGPPATHEVHAKLNKSPGKIGTAIFLAVLAIGFIYAAAHLISDLSVVHSPSIYPFVLLGVALLVALGFEFVNGFHDTANAVATVIYTHSLDPHIAVALSGALNFLGVVLSTGAVAFGIISLLPVELILQVGAGAGFAMVFALLTAAIIWNLGTWYFGLPSSSSHTLIGSIIGVGIANQLMSVKTGTSGVDWGQAANIGKSLLLSPLVGFIFAALLLLVCKAVITKKELYVAPVGTTPPPFWIRCLLVLTCTGVSFFHGSNDGQKGMGLIMLILIGTVPTAYALNHAVTYKDSQDFIAVSHEAADVLSKYVSPNAAVGDAHDDVTNYIRDKDFTPNTMLALRTLVSDIGNETALYKEMKNIPNDQVRNFRNDMYLIMR